MSTLLIDNMPLLSEAPEGIKRIRELILILAVRGKLVSQDPSDEPVNNFLRRHSVKSSHHPLSGWAEVPLGNLGEILGGSTPSKSNPEFWNGDIPWVSPKDMKLSIIQDSQDHISAKALLETSVKVIPPKSLLMVVRGMILAHSFPVALNARVVTINQDMKALVPPNEISDYLLMYLQAAKGVMVGLVDRSSHGTCKLISEKLWSHIVSLPPLAEQQRIVAKVDELMTLCDCLETQQVEAESAHARLVQALLDSLTQARDATDFAARWQRLAGHFHTLFTTESSIDALKQTLLQLAVMGKLVPQNPSEKIANELLEYKTQKNSRLDESCLNLPNSWVWIKGENVASFVDPHPSHRTPPAFLGGVPYVGYSDISFTTGINFEKARKVSSAVFTEHQARYQLKNGDFVFGKIGTIGKPFFLSQPFNYCLSANLILIQPRLNYVDPRYLAFYFDSPFFLAVLERDKTNSTHAVFGIKKARDTAVPLPPLAEQRRIVAKVDALMTLCDQLKSRLIQTRQLNEQLARTLVEQAVA